MMVVVMLRVRKSNSGELYVVKCVNKLCHYRYKYGLFYGIISINGTKRNLREIQKKTIKGTEGVGE